MKNSVQVPAQLSRVSALVDRSVSLGFKTSELSSEEKTILFNLQNSSGYLLFKPDSQWKENEIPKKKSGFDGKSPSERLHDVIFVYWKQNKEMEEPIFQVYYEKVMNGYINQIKSLLRAF